MENIKEIWKKGAAEHIEPCSVEELNEAVVRSAQRSIAKIYPRIFLMVVTISVIIMLIWIMFLRNMGTGQIILMAAALLILTVSYIIVTISARKMLKDPAGESVKKWLEYRIKEIRKGVRFNSKYGVAVAAGSLLLMWVLLYLFRITGSTSIHISTMIITSVILVLFIWYRLRKQTRRYRDILRELEEMYGQFED